MVYDNDVLTIILGCESDAQFEQTKSRFTGHHPHVMILKGPYTPYRFAESLICTKIIEMISDARKQYVALLENAFVNSDCVKEDLRSLYLQKCRGAELLCHLTNGGKDIFRTSRQFMKADDACFGKTDDILKYAFYKNDCPTKE